MIVALIVSGVAIDVGLAQVRVEGNSNGYLFRIASDDAIWVIDQGKRRHLHLGAAKTLYGDKLPFAQISSAELAKYPVGLPIKDGSFLAQRDRDLQVFWIDTVVRDGKEVLVRRAVESDDAFRDYQWDRGKLRTVRAAELEKYPEGDAIRAVPKQEQHERPGNPGK
jgi:hypothetical protein